MDRGLAVLLTAVVGGLIALQAPLNAGLAKATNNLGAAFISFLVGTILLGAVLVLSGKASGLGSTLDVHWYYLTGGVLGLFYVTAVLITVNSVGAGGVAAATVTGQLIAAVAIDRLGILGLERVALTPARLLGVALLLAGTYLVVR